MSRKDFSDEGTSGQEEGAGGGNLWHAREADQSSTSSGVCTDHTKKLVYLGGAVSGVKGYKAVKKAVITALESGDYQHEARGAIEVKNLLSTGHISSADVITIIKGSNGTNYECSPLHGSSKIDCHLIKSGGWYVKFYFLDPTTTFISVHQ